jgi:hypothetical protein
MVRLSLQVDKGRSQEEKTSPLKGVRYMKKKAKPRRAAALHNNVSPIIGSRTRILFS